MSDPAAGRSQEQTASEPPGVAGVVHEAGCQAKAGIGEVREAIRAQPITAALVVFTLGYLFGRLGALVPSRSR